jgi:hypothetical protein
MTKRKAIYNILFLKAKVKENNVSKTIQAQHGIAFFLCNQANSILSLFE